MPRTGMTLQRWCFAGAVLCYALAAWFGVGYYGEDEFQHVILLAEHLRGHVDLASLPLDYHQGWRGMLLPAMAASVFSVLEFCGIHDPFTLTFFLRLVTGGFALGTMRSFTRALHDHVKPESTAPLLVLTSSLWFLPLLLVRFNGEAWSALFFLRGTTQLLSTDRSKWFAGVWLAAATICRPAVALLAAAALVWSLSRGTLNRKHLLTLLVAGATTLASGVLLDSVIHGYFTLTLWNYGTAVLTGEEAARFTELPWYQYVLFTLKYLTLPIGALVLAAFGTLLVLRPTHVLVWLIVPFLLVHSILPVKEVRFLFPLAPLIPWLLIAAKEAMDDRWPGLFRNIVWHLAFVGVVLVNMLALMVGLATPAGNGRIALAQTIANRAHGQAVHIDHAGDWRQWIPPFFLPPGSTERFVKTLEADQGTRPHYLIAREGAPAMDVRSLRLIEAASPAWTHRVLGLYGLEDGHVPLVLYEVRSNGPQH